MIGALVAGNCVGDPRTAAATLAAIIRFAIGPARHATVILSMPTRPDWMPTSDA
jgi:hypothetical protein